MWQPLGKEDPLPVFCVLIMVSGVLAYLLAVYQIFLGLEEDKVVTDSGEEAGQEGQPENVWTTRELEDIAAGGGDLRPRPTDKATVWPEMGREREEMTRGKGKENQSKESIKLKGKGAKHGEVGSDSEEGSSSDKKVSGKVNFESCHEQGLEVNVEIEIPSFVMENSENKESGAEHDRIRNKGMVTYLGFRARDIRTKRR